VAYSCPAFFELVSAKKHVKSVTLDLLIQVETEKKEVDYDDDTDIEFTFKWHFEKARHLKAIEQEDVEFQIRNGDIEVVENLYKKQMILAKKYFEDGMALRKIEEQIRYRYQS
jgi:hypothetical protein